MVPNPEELTGCRITPLLRRVAETPGVRSSAKGKMPDVSKAVTMLRWMIHVPNS